MEPKKVFLPNYANYILPPTPSGSSTDTAPSPSNSEYEEHKMHFYNEYSYTQLHTTLSNVEQFENTKEYKEDTYQPNSLSSMEAHHLATQNPDVKTWAQTQHQENHLLTSNQVTDISSEQPQSPLTPPPSSIPNDGSPKTKKKIRPRTQYSSSQIAQLESAYQQSRYLTKLKKLELAEKLQLDEVRIKVWYQNRRMKDKKNFSSGKNEVISKIKNMRGATLPYEEPGILENIQRPVKHEQELSSPSISVRNRLLTHSVWAKGYQPVSPTIASYRSCVQNPYYWQTYAHNHHNTAYPVPNEYLNQYYGQPYHAEGYFNSQPSYQYNVPMVPSSNTEQEKIKSENSLSSQEEFTFDFAAAQELLSKTIQF